MRVRHWRQDWVLEECPDIYKTLETLKGCSEAVDFNICVEMGLQRIGGSACAMTFYIRLLVFF